MGCADGSQEGKEALSCKKRRCGTRQEHGRGACLDLGAGCGRVSQRVLTPMGWAPLHLVEPSAPLLAKAQKVLPGAVGYNVSAQQFDFPIQYDLIFAHWLLSYLSDADVVAVCRSCAAALAENGTLVVKDNVGKRRWARGDFGKNRTAKRRNPGCFDSIEEAV